LFNCGFGYASAAGRMDRALLLHRGKLVAGTDLPRG